MENIYHIEGRKAREWQQRRAVATKHNKGLIWKLLYEDLYNCTVSVLATLRRKEEFGIPMRNSATQGTGNELVNVRIPIGRMIQIMDEGLYVAIDKMNEIPVIYYNIELILDVYLGKIKPIEDIYWKPNKEEARGIDELAQILYDNYKGRIASATVKMEEDDENEWFNAYVIDVNEVTKYTHKDLPVRTRRIGG